MSRDDTDIIIILSIISIKNKKSLNSNNYRSKPELLKPFKKRVIKNYLKIKKKSMLKYNYRSNRTLLSLGWPAIFA